MFRAGSRSVGLVMMGVIALVLAVFLIITWAQGDTTNHLGDRQPSPSPAGSSAPWPGHAPSAVDGVGVRA